MVSQRHEMRTSKARLRNQLFSSQLRPRVTCSNMRFRKRSSPMRNVKAEVTRMHVHF